MSQEKPGWIECGNCEGSGLRAVAGTTDHEPCKVCDGNGIVECEHQEQERYTCLDCGMNLMDDAMDAAEAIGDMLRDMAIDAAQESKAFGKES